MADACSMPSSKPIDENGRVRLTRMTEKGGWAAKWSPGDLQEIMKKIAPAADSELLLGFDTSDDAAVYRIVRNVFDFGAFVDIGVKQDGLVHISKMAERFVRHLSEVVSVGDNVTVWVTGIDKTRGKISLSMVKGK